MAVVEALHQFRFAAMFLAPWEYQTGQFTPGNLDENARRYWKLWLTRAAVEFLDPADFSGLTCEQADLVSRNREEFLANVPAAGAEPSVDELNRARAAFLVMFPLVQKYLYDTPTLIAARVVMATVREQKRWFVGVDFLLGDDSTGDPALWAWLIVADGTPDDEAFQREWPHIRRWMREDLRTRGIKDRYAYFHLRTATEQAELLRGEVE